MNEKGKSFKTKVTGNDKSILFDNMTIKEVVRGKIDYIIRMAMDEAPYIASVTKNQISWGGGKLFNNLEEDDYRRIGMVGGYGTLKHLPGRKPKDVELRLMMQNFGVALQYPPKGLFDIIQNVFRAVEKENIETNLALLPTKGYLDGNGKTINPAWNKGEDFHGSMIASYLFFNIDKMDIINDYLNTDAPKWLVEQVKRTMETVVSFREGQVNMGLAIADNAEAKRLKSELALKGLNITKVIE